MKRPELAAGVKAIYYLLPNLTLFNLNDAFSGGQMELTLGFFLWPLGYALLYGGIMLLLSFWQFEKKEY